MPTDHDNQLDPEENALAQMGYELEDVEYKSLARSIFWFFVFVVFCGTAGVVIFFLFIGESPSGAWNKFMNPPANTAPFVSHRPAENNPLLQTNITARTDIRDLRLEEANLMDNPSWVDKDKNVVRIPVSRAMDLYLQKMGANPNQPTTIKSGAPPIDLPSPEPAE